MAYTDIHKMTQSMSLRGRIAAAASVEANSGAVMDEPDADNWAHKHRYEMCSAPGWGDAWASAVASNNPDPGADASVITDSMILSQTQAVMGAT